MLALLANLTSNCYKSPLLVTLIAYDFRPQAVMVMSFFTKPQRSLANALRHEGPRRGNRLPAQYQSTGPQGGHH